MLGGADADDGGEAGGGRGESEVGVCSGIALVGIPTGGAVVELPAPASPQFSRPQGVTGLGGSKMPSFPPQYLPHHAHAPLRDD